LVPDERYVDHSRSRATFRRPAGLPRCSAGYKHIRASGSQARSVLGEPRGDAAESKKSADARSLIDAVGNARSRDILLADKVTEAIEQFLHQPVAVAVLYQGTPYMLPSEVRIWLRVASVERAPRNIIQRDVRLFEKANDRDELLLFSRSWINIRALTSESQEKLQARTKTIGTILREGGYQCSYRNLGYERHVSERNGMAFGMSGAREAVQRVRMICIGDVPAIIIHEFVPT
jgi:chorismate-pyruvate lyase